MRRHGKGEMYEHRNDWIGKYGGRHHRRHAETEDCENAGTDGFGSNRQNSSPDGGEIWYPDDKRQSGGGRMGRHSSAGRKTSVSGNRDCRDKRGHPGRDIAGHCCSGKKHTVV